MLPHVDLFLPVHNLKSLVDLARTLSQPHSHPLSHSTTKEPAQWR
jgi:hypothetical protein